jgi:hypothetical protein
MIIEPKDILDWCFTLASIDFGVFGFLYSIYATAMFQLTQSNPVPPPITRNLKNFCRAVALVLLVLTAIAVVTGYKAMVGGTVWIIILCFVLLTGFSLSLVYRMN